jgi:hypothetical protein
MDGLTQQRVTHLLIQAPTLGLATLSQAPTLGLAMDIGHVILVSDKVLHGTYEGIFQNGRPFRIIKAN